MIENTLKIDIRHKAGDFGIKAKIEAQPGITTLFGKSGAGKSSIISMIAGLVQPDSGRITIGEEVLFDSSQNINRAPENRNIGYVFQDARLFPHMNVRQNLSYGLGRMEADQRQPQFDAVVTLLGLENLLTRKPLKLSGGEKQRVAIGRALLSNPAVLLMDEPLASLDAARKSEILPFIENLAQEFALPIIYVSHAVEEVVRLSDSLVLISEGHVAAQGTVEALMSRIDLSPITGRYEAGAVLTPIVSEHLTDLNLTQLNLLGHNLFVPAVPITPDTAIRLRVRARDVSLALERPQGTSVLNMVPGQIHEIDQDDGPHATVAIKVQGTPANTDQPQDQTILARITKKSLQDMNLQNGVTVWAMIKSVAIDRHSLGGHGRGTKRS
ncbi:MAG: molybdenum ABC transporter ATP-binding protein [Magnetovibrio sp.]|nr:molybdenum ABC transporter ATP-binding protein [Magnetovibrio sp.]